MNYKNIQKKIHQNAIEHGWWDTKRPIPELISLIHSEISEAFDAMMNGDDDEFRREIADIYIRHMDMCEGYGVVIEFSSEEYREFEKMFNYQDANILYLLNWCHLQASELLEEYRKTGELHEFYVKSLAMSLTFISEFLQIDIDNEILAKHEYNKTREYRHGNKVC